MIRTDQADERRALGTCGPTRSSPASWSLCVIVPVFNEVANVDRVLEHVLAQPSVAEVLVVDDHSGDGTWGQLAAWPGRDCRVRVMRHGANVGKGAAIRTALAYATSSWVVIQDADLEYSPEDYASMLGLLLNGEADVVYGSRFLGGTRVTTPGHWLVNWGLTTVANLVTGLRLTDVHTCLKMFPTALLKSVSLQEQRFGFCPEVTAKLARIRGLRLVEVPVTYRPRKREEGKKVGIRDGLRAIYCLIRYTFAPHCAACGAVTLARLPESKVADLQ